MRRRAQGCAAGLLAAVLLATPCAAGVREIETLPGIAQWGSTAEQAGGDARLEHRQQVLVRLERGDDAGALAYVASIAGREPALAVSLHATLAAAYARDRRLYRATQHLDAIPAARLDDQARYLRAVIAGRQQRLADAGKILDDLGRRLPEDPVIARDQAQIAALRGNAAVAADAALRLKRLRPNDAWAATTLARSRIEQGRDDEARRVLEDLLLRQPRSGSAALQLGLLELADRRPAEARAAFARARSIEARDATPYAGEAVAQLWLGRRSEAAAAASGAWKQNPYDPVAALVVLLTAAEPRRAVPMAARRTVAAWYPDLETEPLPAAFRAELASDATGSRIGAANLLSVQWPPRRVLEWTKEGSASRAMGPLETLTLARVAIEAGDLDTAARALAALDRDPVARGLVGPLVLAAALASRRGDPAGARAAMDRALAISPRSARLRTLSGDLYLALGQPARAVPEFRASLAAAPDDPRVLNQLAASLALAGRTREWAEGLALAERGLGLQPHYMLRAHLLDTRADLLYRLGRTPQALSAYRELAGTVGGITTPEAWQRLGDLARAAGDTTLAQTAYEEALDLGRSYPGRAEAARRLDELSAAGSRR
jgi:tetratricopeptide (TPR) repeat protein